MTTTTVNLRLNPPFDGEYRVYLVGSSAPTGGLDLTGNAVIPRRVAVGPIVAGVAAVSLQPTSEVTPTNTVYRADLFTHGARQPEALYFTVPVSPTPVEAVAYIALPPGRMTEDGGGALVPAGSTIADGGGS